MGWPIQRVSLAGLGRATRSRSKASDRWPGAQGIGTSAALGNAGRALHPKDSSSAFGVMRDAEGEFVDLMECLVLELPATERAAAHISRMRGRCACYRCAPVAKPMRASSSSVRVEMLMTDSTIGNATIA